MNKNCGVRGPQCKLKVSNNHLTVQQTNFILSNSRFSINGFLDLSYNKISKFESPNHTFGDLNHQKQIPSVSVPLCKPWLRITGNKIFSIANLVYITLNIDLDYVENSSFTSFVLTNVKLFSLHLFFQTFPYEYESNCDMEKYLKLQNLTEFEKTIQEYKKRVRILHPKYILPASANLINNLKCGSPKHLKGKYLHQLKNRQCKKPGVECISIKQCTCIETPFNSTVRIKCTDTKLKYIYPLLSEIPLMLKYTWDLMPYDYCQLQKSLKQHV